MKYVKDSFIVVPNKQQLDGKPSQYQSIYFWICNYADKKGQCFPARSTLAKNAGVGIHTVDKILKQMQEDGLLSFQQRYNKDNKSQKSNLYQLLLVEEIDTPTHESTTPLPVSVLPPLPVSVPLTQPNKNSINLTVSEGKPTQVSSSEIAEAIERFQSINDNYSKWFRNTTQRKAISELIEKYTVRRVIKAVHLAHFCYKDRYFPNFTTPYELVEKWSKVMKFYKGKLTDKRFVDDFEKFAVEMERQRNDGKESKKETIVIAGLSMEYGIVD